MMNALDQKQISRKLTTENRKPETGSLISILIVTHNKLEYLKECLASIAKQTYPNIEVIVVDNNSNDGTTEYLKNKTSVGNADLHSLQSPENLYFAGGNNLAYQKASGEYLFLLNNDAYIENDTVEKLVNFLEENKQVGVVQNKIVLAKEPNKIDSIGSFFSITGFLIHPGHSEVGEYSKQQKIFAAKGASIMVRRGLIEQVGLFDDDYKMYFEDTDLCWKAYLTGSEVVYYPDTTTYHYVGTSTDKKSLPIADFHSFKNRISTMLKNLSLPFLIVILPIHLAICEILIIIYLFKDIRIAKSIILAILWNISNLGKILAKRRQIQKLRKVSDFAFLPGLMRFPSIKYAFSFTKGYINRR